MAAVFAAFVLVLCLSDVAMLIRFFSLKEKKELKEQIYAVSRLDLDDANEVIKALSDNGIDTSAIKRKSAKSAQATTPYTV